MATNWIVPRLAERPPLFHRIVQGKLGEFAARGWNGSPHVYAAVQDLVIAELKLRGSIVFEGFKRGLISAGCAPSDEFQTELKREIEKQMLECSIQLRGAVEYVKKACNPPGAPDVTDLRWPVVHEVASEFDIFCVFLRVSANRTSQTTPSMTNNFNAPVGSFQTGASASATVIQMNQPANSADLVEALSRIEEALKQTREVSQQPEVLELVGELKVEAAKPKPNRLKLSSVLLGLAPIISAIADAKPAYDNLKKAAQLFGIPLP